MKTTFRKTRGQDFTGLGCAKRSDRLMWATASLTGSEFEELARRIAVRWAERRTAQTAAGAKRQRRPGGGRKGGLVTAEQKLFFICSTTKPIPPRTLCA